MHDHKHKDVYYAVLQIDLQHTKLASDNSMMQYTVCTVIRPVVCDAFVYR
jgi:hypothetical protein